MLLVIFLTGAILWNFPWSNYDNFVFVGAVEPGYLDFDNLPETNFSCEGKVIGGYYADIETGCQMFHVCTIGQKSEITDIKFLCLNGTVFDQETRVCERLDEVDCSRSESFFDLNLELYGNNGGGYGIQAEDEGKESERAACEEEYDDEGENTCKKHPSHKSDVAAEDKHSQHKDWKEQPTTSRSSVSGISRVGASLSTTTAKPSPAITTSSRPPTTSTSQPKFVYHSELSIPTTTPDTGLQLLALHESFQHNLQQSKSRPYNAPTKHNSTTPSAFSYSRTPLPFSTYQVVSNTPHIQPSPFSHPLPSKLPNSLSNLSQNNKNTRLTNALVNSNPNPSQYEPVTFKPETAGDFYTRNKQHSQKVTNTNKVSLTVPQQAPSLLPTSKQQQQLHHHHHNIDTPVLYTYKVLSTDAGRPDRFESNVRYALQQASPATASGHTFKMDSPPHNAARSTYTTAQNRPYGFRPKTSHFFAAKEEVDEYADDDEQDERSDKEPSQQPHLRPKSDQYDSNNSHSNFARAIAERPNNANDSTDAVSVVLSTSSVSSSSASSKLQSAIPNNNTNTKNASKSTLLLGTSTVKLMANITEINDSLTEEAPYYDEANDGDGGGGGEYDENSPEYKDLMYPADVQKIKHR